MQASLLSTCRIFSSPQRDTTHFLAVSPHFLGSWCPVQLFIYLFIYLAEDSPSCQLQLLWKRLSLQAFQAPLKFSQNSHHGQHVPFCMERKKLSYFLILFLKLSFQSAKWLKQFVKQNSSPSTENQATCHVCRTLRCFLEIPKKT